MYKHTAILQVTCPDQIGIVSSITSFLQANNGNILEIEQHVDQSSQVFFMRAEWDLSRFTIKKEKIADYFQTLVAQKFNMTFRLFFSDRKPKMAIMVSKYGHCLMDIISRVQTGEWDLEIPFVISNHEDFQEIVEKFDIPFYHIPKSRMNKQSAEEKEIKLLKESDTDFMVLARYMQVLSSEFLNEFTHPVINIHHSFLPAFPGAKPYHQAYDRGVKVIGATSHYVTAELDAGPIIHQDVARVSHIDDVDDLIRKGRDLERLVLATAIFKELQHKIIPYKNKTVVFN